MKFINAVMLILVVLACVGWIGYMGYELLQVELADFWRQVLGVLLSVVGIAKYYKDAWNALRKLVLTVRVKVDADGNASIRSGSVERLARHVRSRKADFIQIRNIHLERLRRSLGSVQDDPVEGDPGFNEREKIAASIVKFCHLIDYLDEKFRVYFQGALTSHEVVSILLSIVEACYGKNQEGRHQLYALNLSAKKPWGFRSNRTLYAWFAFYARLPDSAVTGKRLSVYELPRQVVVESFIPSLLLASEVLMDEIRFGGGVIESFDDYLELVNWVVGEAHPKDNFRDYLGMRPEDQTAKAKLEELLGGRVYAPGELALEDLTNTDFFDATYRLVDDYSDLTAGKKQTEVAG